MKTSIFLNYAALLTSLTLAGCGGGGDGNVGSDSGLAPVAATTSDAATVATTGSAQPASIDPVVSVKQPDKGSAVATAANGHAALATPSAAKETPAAGAQVVIEPSRPDLSLDLFNAEVRAAMDKFDTAEQRLNWVAVYSQHGKRAVVTVVGIAGKAPEYVPGAIMRTAVLPKMAGDELDERQHKKAACLGGDTYKSAEYDAKRAAYDDYTEVMALGLPPGSTKDQASARLDQLQAEESKLPPDQSIQRYEARAAIRNQRYKALDDCVGPDSYGKQTY